MSKKKNKKKNLADKAPEQLEVKDEAVVEETAETEAPVEEAVETEVAAEETSPTELSGEATEYVPAAEVYLAEKEPSHDKPKAKTASPARIIISLTLICALIAALLGAVNAATAGKIAENTEREKALAVQKIFGSHVTIEEYTDFPEAATMEAYLIFRSDMLYGYCANVRPGGFGGEINMMVGVDYTGSVCGVNIVSMSETPGLGSKANTPDFLAQFNGKYGNISTANGIDAISGATITSDAVCAGVNSALAAGIDLPAIAAERGVLLYTEELDTTPPETETTAPADNGEAPAVPSEEPGRLEETVEYVDGIENPNGAPNHERPAVEIPVIDETMVYETETTAPDTETDTEEIPEETTTRAPETTPAPETTTNPPETTTKEPETTEKEPETTTTATEATESESITTEQPEETTGVPEETTGQVEETTGVADETNGEEASA